MIWFILAIVGIIILYKELYKVIENRISTTMITIFLMILISPCSFAMSSVTGDMLHNNVNTTPVVIETSDIVTLKDNINIHGEMHGNMFVHSEYIDEDLYYYYMTKNEFGYCTKKAKAVDCQLKIDNENPHIEIINYQFKNKTWYLFGIDTVTKYIIYCPEGTIDESFYVDLE